MDRTTRKRLGWIRLAPALAAALAVLVAGAVMAYAKGGTAKPPVGAVSPFITPTLPDPSFTTSPTDIHGFDETGFIQDATVSADNSDCPDVTQDNRLGGTGFGVAFLGALRTLSAAIPPDHRGAVMSAFYVVAYLSLSLPAVIAGFVVTSLGLESTFEIFGSVVAGLALLVALEAWRQRPQPALELAAA